MPHEKWMKEALKMAEKGWGNTNPNPLVGAVITKEDQLISKGYHEYAGGPHAEINALKKAGDASVGSTMYVTLEPCSHYGKTPPCAEAIIKAGVKKVIIAAGDPNEKVAGKGEAMLRKAGIDVITGVLEKEARKQNEIFMHYITEKKPYLIAKAAMSLDGKIATKQGHSQWITGEKARNHAHWVRQRVSAILVGVNTVIADNPQLTVRLPLDKVNQPLRVVLDSKGNIPLTSTLVLTAKEIKTMVATTDQMPVDIEKKLLLEGVEVVRFPHKQGQVDIPSLIDYFASKEVDSVLVEGGSSVMASFISEKMINKLLWYIAPKIIGGSQAPGPIGGDGILHMKEALPITEMETIRLGEDWLMTGYMKGAEKCLPE